MVVDLKPSPLVRTKVLGRADQVETGRQVWGNMVWLSSDRIGFFPAEGAIPGAVIFDGSLRQLGGIDHWAASTSLLVGDGIVGLGQGRLRVADLPYGPIRVVEQFESRTTITLAALPGVTTALLAAPPETTEDADLPILPIAAGTAAVALLAGLLRFGRTAKKRPHA